jgi:hypothetical protein
MPATEDGTNRLLDFFAYGMPLTRSHWGNS